MPGGVVRGMRLEGRRAFFIYQLEARVGIERCLHRLPAQYPDLQGYFNIDFTGLQELSGTIRHIPALTRHLHPAYSVIEEIVEGFVEGFWVG
jgi:hypothetical protein